MIGNQSPSPPKLLAVRGEFRDTDEFALPCVLTTDLDAVKTRLDARNPYDSFIVDVPKSHVFKPEEVERPAWLPKYLSLASGDLYCRRRGFLTE